MKNRIVFEAPLSEFEKNMYREIDATTLGSHPELLMDIFKRHQVETYLTIFDYFNREKNGNYYHGVTHAYATALNCYEGALYSSCTNKEIRALLVAGLFHDIDHSHGEKTDRQNVNRAKRVLTTLHANMAVHERLKDDELQMALKAITGTCWPYASAPTTITEKVLRDADLMTPYLPTDTKLKLFAGLINEISTTEKRQISVREFCGWQSTFSMSVLWNTRWATLKAVTLDWPRLNREIIRVLQAQQPVEEPAI